MLPVEMISAPNNPASLVVGFEGREVIDRGLVVPTDLLFVVIDQAGVIRLPGPVLLRVIDFLDELLDRSFAALECQAGVDEATWVRLHRQLGLFLYEVTESGSADLTETPHLEEVGADRLPEHLGPSLRDQVLGGVEVLLVDLTRHPTKHLEGLTVVTVRVVADKLLDETGRLAELPLHAEVQVRGAARDTEVREDVRRVEDAVLAVGNDRALCVLGLGAHERSSFPLGECIRGESYSLGKSNFPRKSLFQRTRAFYD